MSEFLTSETEREFGIEFCALNCIESKEELRERKEDLLNYIRDRLSEVEG